MDQFEFFECVSSTNFGDAIRRLKRLKDAADAKDQMRKRATVEASIGEAQAEWTTHCLKCVFDAFDQDESGEVDAEEMRAAMEVIELNHETGHFAESGMDGARDRAQLQQAKDMLLMLIEGDEDGSIQFEAFQDALTGDDDHGVVRARAGVILRSVVSLRLEKATKKKMAAEEDEKRLAHALHQAESEGDSARIAEAREAHANASAYRHATIISMAQTAGMATQFDWAAAEEGESEDDDHDEGQLNQEEEEEEEEMIDDGENPYEDLSGPPSIPNPHPNPNPNPRSCLQAK